MRRIIGYDRFEGREAWEALSKLYRVLRVYVNFFQPSLKLLSKERHGAKVSKKYDTAKTPHQRVMLVETVGQKIKDALGEQYKMLDPVALLAKLERLQSQLFEYAWSNNGNHRTIEAPVAPHDLIALPEPKEATENSERKNIASTSEKAILYHYRQTKNNDDSKRPRDWRTRKDPFERVWDEIKLKLELNPEQTAKALLEGLIAKYPDDFIAGQLRTLQRRVSHWRRE